MFYSFEKMLRKKKTRRSYATSPCLNESSMSLFYRQACAPLQQTFYLLPVFAFISVPRLPEWDPATSHLARTLLPVSPHQPGIHFYAGAVRQQASRLGYKSPFEDGQDLHPYTPPLVLFQTRRQPARPGSRFAGSFAQTVLLPLSV